MKYRKKPVVVEAVQHTFENKVELANFLKRDILTEVLVIETLEGEMIANIGDWIIKGVKGEFYPCKPDIFEMIYEAVRDEQSEDSSAQPTSQERLK